MPRTGRGKKGKIEKQKDMMREKDVAIENE